MDNNLDALVYVYTTILAPLVYPSRVTVYDPRVNLPPRNAALKYAALKYAALKYAALKYAALKYAALKYAANLSHPCDNRTTPFGFAAGPPLPLSRRHSAVSCARSLHPGEGNAGAYVSTTEVLERLAHFALCVVLLVGLALFAGYTIHPRRLPPPARPQLPSPLPPPSIPHRPPSMSR